MKDKRPARLRRIITHRMTVHSPDGKIEEIEFKVEGWELRMDQCTFYADMNFTRQVRHAAPMGPARITITGMVTKHIVRDPVTKKRRRT